MNLTTNASEVLSLSVALVVVYCCCCDCCYIIVIVIRVIDVVLNTMTIS